jgi:hypothetical protein
MQGGFMSQSILISWIVVIVLFIGCRMIITSRLRKNWQLNLEHFLNIITSAYGIVSGSNIIYKIATSQNLMKLLGDDTITLFVGASVVIWLSIQQMLKP